MIIFSHIKEISSLREKIKKLERQLDAQAVPPPPMPSPPPPHQDLK